MSGNVPVKIEHQHLPLALGLLLRRQFRSALRICRVDGVDQGEDLMSRFDVRVGGRPTAPCCIWFFSGIAGQPPSAGLQAP